MSRVGVRAHKWLKAFHIVFSGVWVGTTLGALILNLRASSATDGASLSAHLVSAQLIANLIPMASVGTIVTGLLLSLLTSWGFFKYWPVVLQLAAAVLVIVIAQIWLDPAAVTLRDIAETKGIHALQNADYSLAFRLLVLCAGVNLAILVSTSLVATIKPWGRTRRVNLSDEATA